VIFRMVAENPAWGAPRIHGELLMLGFDVSERTISRWMKRAPADPEPAKRWRAFLRNHRESIAAMDFFTVPTITFGVLCLAKIPSGVEITKSHSLTPGFDFDAGTSKNVQQ
jgi:putative transposase